MATSRIRANSSITGPISFSEIAAAIPKGGPPYQLASYRNLNYNESEWVTWTSMESSNLPISVSDLFGASGGIGTGQTYYNMELFWSITTKLVIYSPIPYTSLQSTYSTVQRNDSPYTMLYASNSEILTPTYIPAGYYSLYGNTSYLNLRAYSTAAGLFASWGGMFENPSNHFYGICTNSTFYWDGASYSYTLGIYMFYAPGQIFAFTNNPADIATTLDSTNVGHAAYVKSGTMYFGAVNKAQALTGTYTTVGESAMFGVTSFSKQSQFRITSRFNLAESTYIKVYPQTVVIKGFVKKFNTEISDYVNTSAQQFLKLSGYYSDPVGQYDQYGYLIIE